MNPIRQLSKLTERQRDVLRLFCDGLDYKAIGETLFIAVPTVKTHMGNIYIKLDLYDLPPAKRRIVLIEKYCPLLRKAELPPAPPDETDEPESVPAAIMKIIDEDEKALVPYEPPRRPPRPPRPTVTIIKPEPGVIIEPLPRPRRARWLVVGVVLGALLAVGIIYAARGFLWAEEQPQDTKTSEVEYREVTQEVTTVPASPQPPPASVIPTQESTVTQEETVVDATSTSQDTPTPELPTPTPVPPTPTPLPTPTMPEDTPPGSILGIGESWRQNGVRLRLEDVSLYPSSECLKLMFNFFNDTDHEIVVTIEEEDFFAEDNLGRRWRLITLSEGGTSCREGWTDDISKAVAAGDRLRISYDAWSVSFSGFVTDVRVNQVIVAVDGLSQISGARWSVPIYH